MMKVFLRIKAGYMYYTFRQLHKTLTNSNSKWLVSGFSTPEDRKDKTDSTSHATLYNDQVAEISPTALCQQTGLDENQVEHFEVC